MKDKYEIGTRLRGEAKDYIKALICEVSKKFPVNNLEKRIVPHNTYLRPFTTNNEEELIDTFDKTLSQSKNLIIYKLDGFGYFEKPKEVIYANIRFNPNINKLIKSLEKNLDGKMDYIYPRARDGADENEINLHSSIANKIPEKYFEEIKSFIDKKPFKTIFHPLFRVYLLKNKKILREYDFTLNQSLERWDAINPLLFKKTIREFENKLGIKVSF